MKTYAEEHNEKEMKDSKGENKEEKVEKGRYRMDGK
jgi:hypothetical protein